MSTVSEFDLLAPKTRECPYDFYAALREEEPVYRVPGQDFFIVSRFDDIVYVAEHPEIFSSSLTGLAFGRQTPEVQRILAQGRPLAPVLVSVDPPEHTRQRRAINRLFYGRVGQHESALRAAAEELVDAFAQAREVEFVAQFAVPLALINVGELMGLPRRDLPQLKQWADESRSGHAGIVSDEEAARLAWSEVEMQRYFDGWIQARSREPGEDFISDLARSNLDSAEPGSSKVSLALLEQMFRAGHQTTIGMLTSGMLLLVQHPEQMEILIAEPSLIPNFVEEVIRLESPIQGMFRVAKLETELHGQPIPAGSRLFLMYASGSRDERHFPDAARLDVRGPSKREHLGFGRGEHFCIGAPLARLVGRVAFETLLRRLRTIQPGRESAYFQYLTNVISIRVLEELHLKFDVTPPSHQQSLPALGGPPSKPGL